MNTPFSPILPPGLVEALRQARSVAVLTGAGISAESGLPTFRDPQTGLWANYRPEELATPQAFRRDPRLVWQWYAQRRERASQVEPNMAHFALAEIEQRIPTFTLITQNVDGLHQRAGSHNVIELHGNISRTKCFDEDVVIETWQDTGEIPPHCPRCGGLLRPDVVWFGEQLPEQAFVTAIGAAANCDLFFSIGTSGLVEPAASLTQLARRMGATIAIINLDVAPLAEGKLYHVKGTAGKLLPELVRAAWPSNSSRLN